MQNSAEIRWFWRQSPSTKTLLTWFKSRSCHDFQAGGGELRSDIYLSDPNQNELGIKRRGLGPGVEVKGLVCIRKRKITLTLFEHRVEIWTKWKTNAIKVNKSATVKMKKLRWLRKFDTTGKSPFEIKLNRKELPIKKTPLPEQGCNVEFTVITMSGGEIWHSFGFEAFGPFNTLESSLLASITVLARRKLVLPKGAIEASYPMWLHLFVPPKTLPT